MPWPAALHHTLATAGTSLAVIAAILYGTGFLILSTFLDRFGLRAATGDFLRLTYIQIGLLYGLFPFLIIIPWVVFIENREPPRTKQKQAWFSMVNYGNALLFCYWIASFAAPGRYHEREGAIALLVCFTIFGIYFGSRLTKRGGHSDFKVVEWAGGALDSVSDRSPWFDRHRQTIVRSGLSMGLAACDWAVAGSPAIVLWVVVAGAFALPAVIRHYQHKPAAKGQTIAAVAAVALAFGTMVMEVAVWARFDLDDFSRCCSYFFITLLLAAFAVREARRIPAWYKPMAYNSGILFAACVIFGLFYLSVLAFAYGVYPRIPAARGGGNYSYTSDVVFYLKSNDADHLPPAIINPMRSPKSHYVLSVPLKVIEQTADTYFVARPNDAGGPDEWQNWHLPTIYSIARSSTVSVVQLRSHRYP
ncbi:MAG TPA: hypothetical protein VHE61_10430 [Opitutaceae bacterium]|nr:hypothetical protein [Opitutaceae bacterium]